MKYGVVISARIDSSRLPGKALLPLGGVPMIIFLLRRLLPSQKADGIIFATTSNTEDDKLADIVAEEGIPVFRGAASDVMRRYVDVAHEYNIKYVVRVTGDCPFVDAKSLDYCLKKCDEFGVFDLATTKSMFPIGIDYEIYRASIMEGLHIRNNVSQDDREHLTKYFYDHSNRFDIHQIKPVTKWGAKRYTYTVDTLSDYKFAQRITMGFTSIYFSIESLITYSQTEGLKENEV